jgi:hypothetical protein
MGIFMSDRGEDVRRVQQYLQVRLLVSRYEVIPRDQPASMTASSTQRAPALRGIFFAEYSSIAS